MPLPPYIDFPGYEGANFDTKVFFKPPTFERKALKPGTIKTFPEKVDLSFDNCKQAILKFAKDHCCYGTKPAKEMEITKTTEVTALHYKLDTFTESRACKKKAVPYRGGVFDSPLNGLPPGPWQMHIEPRRLFEYETVKLEVPHTAIVKFCLDCRGRGWNPCRICQGGGMTPCLMCLGLGQGEQGFCNWCNGSGVQICVRCFGSGVIKCDKCKGSGQMRLYHELEAIYRNHYGDFVYETTDLPDYLVTNVRGMTLFEQQAPLVMPIEDHSITEINENSAKLIKEHQRRWPEELILQQKHELLGVPVTEVEYKWEEVKTRFWVYGLERKVYAPDYPQQCCCGCSIL